MQKTFDLSLELCTSGWNAYAAMALPGSMLYKQAVQSRIKLPDNYEAFSFHSYECSPLPTKKLKAHEILKFRDNAFHLYHSNKKILNRIEKRFGIEAKKNIQNKLKIKLKEELLKKNLLVKFFRVFYKNSAFFFINAFLYSEKILF